MSDDPTVPGSAATPRAPILALRDEVAKVVVGQEGTLSGVVAAFSCAATSCSRAYQVRPRRCS